MSGVSPWQGAEIWVNPEIDQGFGLSNTLGLAGFPSGEAYKLGATIPIMRVPRCFIRQTIDLGRATEKVDADINQFAGKQSADRLVLTVGKFSVSDMFDTVKYAHDPRGDFLNWTLVDAGTFDYAADAWGYTYGAAAEWYHGPWAVRGGLFDLSKVPNSIELDRFHQFQIVYELEHRHEIAGQPGSIVFDGFVTRGRMGQFRRRHRVGAGDRRHARTPRWCAAMPEPHRLQPQLRAADRAECRHVRPVRLGERQSRALRIHRCRPHRVDRRISSPASCGAGPTTASVSPASSTASPAPHIAYLNAGGLGILVGDGQLPHPGIEQIIEAYYSFPLGALRPPWTISSSSIPPTTATAGRCRCSRCGCTPNSSDRFPSANQ